MRKLLLLLFIAFLVSCSNNNTRPSLSVQEKLPAPGVGDTLSTIQNVLEAIQAGNYSSALNSIQYQLDLRKDSISFLYFYRGVSYYKLNDNLHAKSSFHQSVANNHPDASIYAWLGDVCQRLNELDSALDYYTVSLNKLGRNPYILNNVGTTYVKQNKPGKAIEIFQELLDRDSVNLDAAYNLAHVYYTNGDFTKASSIVQQYIKLFPEDHGLYNLQGLICAKQGRFNEARKNWETSLQLHPNDNTAAENLKRLRQ